MSIDSDAALKYCQALWHKKILPSFYADISNGAKARIARMYICLMIDVRRDRDGRDIEILRKKYRELTNFITEVLKNGRDRR